MCLHTLYIVHSECLHLTPSPRTGLHYIPPVYCAAVRAWITAYHQQPVHAPYETPLDTPRPCPPSPEQYVAAFAPVPSYALSPESVMLAPEHVISFDGSLDPPHRAPQGSSPRVSPSRRRRHSRYGMSQRQRRHQPMTTGTGTELAHDPELWMRLHFADGTAREPCDVVEAAKRDAAAYVATALSHSQCPRCHDCQVLAWMVRGSGACAGAGAGTAWRQIKHPLRTSTALERPLADVATSLFWARLHGWRSATGWPLRRSEASTLTRTTTTAATAATAAIDFGAEGEGERNGTGSLPENGAGAIAAADTEIGADGVESAQKGKRKRKRKSKAKKTAKTKPKENEKENRNEKGKWAPTSLTTAAEEQEEGCEGDDEREQKSVQGREREANDHVMMEESMKDDESLCAGDARVHVHVHVPTLKRRVDTSLLTGKYATPPPTEYEMECMAQHLRDLGLRRSSA